MGIIALVWIVLSILIYFVPSIVASKRYHRNESSILVLNLFLGWTFIGWVIALVWSFSKDIKSSEEISQIKKSESKKEKTSSGDLLFVFAGIAILILIAMLITAFSG